MSDAVAVGAQYLVVNDVVGERIDVELHIIRVVAGGLRGHLRTPLIRRKNVVRRESLAFRTVEFENVEFAESKDREAWWGPRRNDMVLSVLIDDVPKRMIGQPEGVRHWSIEEVSCA